MKKPSTPRVSSLLLLLVFVVSYPPYTTGFVLPLMRSPGALSFSFHHGRRLLTNLIRQRQNLGQHQHPYRHRCFLGSLTSSNSDLVQQRLEVARAKKRARAFSNQQQEARNLYIKDLLSSPHQVPPLYAVKISVCPQLRKELRLNGREKRGRLFVEMDSEACKSLSGFKQELHAFFRCLRKSTYLLNASLPIEEESWSIATNEDVAKVFEKANEYFDQHGENEELKRPTLLVHVSKDPDAPVVETPSYLIDMPDPENTTHMTMLSFYAFQSIDNPDDFAMRLRAAFKPFRALGRIYVANEGINAQMSVPSNVLENFIECCNSIPELKRMENGVNVDPQYISKTDFDADAPFTNLHVRVRRQIVADGLDKELDWQNAGYDMPPLEWHDALQQKEALVLDCRNDYETNVGRFESAVPLNTTNFRDSWSALQEKLEGVPKDAPIMTYCTGGIRCVKVGAYLTQEMGFTNVSRLAGGIIAYDRTLQQNPTNETLFKGTNFVFDGRLGRSITSDELGVCITCGSSTSLVSNCQNPNCHKRMVQCETCRTNYHGTCCDACKQRIYNNNNNMMSKRNQFQQEATQQEEYHTIEDYSTGHSTPPSSFYGEMELNTRSHLPSGSHMVSGASQGRFLALLASQSREGRILELGTFTGYATACLVEGSSHVYSEREQVGGRNGGPYVMSMERDGRAMDLAVAHLKIMSDLGIGQEAAEAACQLRNKKDGVPVIQEDSVFLNYNNKVGCEIVRVTDALATLEEMADGRGNLQIEPFDMVFVDADKTRLLDYVHACVESDRVLKKGGLIVVDNVLWKGLVLEASTGEFSSSKDEDDERRGRRARKLAMKMHRFNSAIVKDDRVEVVVLPMRDGLSVIRKR